MIKKSQANNKQTNKTKQKQKQTTNNKERECKM